MARGIANSKHLSKRSIISCWNVFQFLLQLVSSRTGFSELGPPVKFTPFFLVLSGNYVITIWRRSPSAFLWRTCDVFTGKACWGLTSMKYVNVVLVLRVKPPTKRAWQYYFCIKTSQPSDSHLWVPFGCIIKYFSTLLRNFYERFSVNDQIQIFLGTVWTTLLSLGSTLTVRLPHIL